MVSSLLFLLGYVSLCAPLANHVFKFLSAHGLKAVNFRNDAIPVGFGIMIWLAMLIHAALLGLWRAVGGAVPVWEQDQAASIQGTEYALMMTLVFVAGWLDDTLGDGRIKGFRGHFFAWFKDGMITTGLVKVMAVSAASLWAALLLGGGFSAIAAQWFVMALMTNAFNLLDLRPGRALKVFFALSALLLACSSNAWLPLRCLLPVLVGAAVVLPHDLRAKAMLGDTGANLLGFALGLTIAVTAPTALQWGIAAVLLVFHWIAERHSLSRYIESNRLLSWLDRIGRPDS